MLASYSITCLLRASASNSLAALVKAGKQNLSMCSTTASGESMVIPSNTTSDAPVVAPRGAPSKPRAPIDSGFSGIHWMMRLVPIPRWQARYVCIGSRA